MRWAWILLAALVGAAAISEYAKAHEWYPISCCSGYDCEPVPVDAVEELANGDFRVRYHSKRGGPIDVVVPAKDVKDSQDGRWHACATPVRFMCLFKPSNV